MAPHPQRLTVSRRAWPLAQAFTISRGSRTKAEVVVAEVSDGEFRGRGECVPYPRYGESVDNVVAALEAMKSAVFSGLDRKELQQAMPPGAARNALDCAFWDLDAKRDDRRVADLAGIGALRPVVTAYTLSLDTPEQMGEAAARERHRPLLKLKVTGDGDIERVRAVRRAAPQSRLIIDANEGWNERHLTEVIEALGVIARPPRFAAPDRPCCGPYSRAALGSCPRYAKRVVSIPTIGVAAWQAFAARMATPARLARQRCLA